MAKIRQLALGEWFLNYQLSHGWFPTIICRFIDIDVTLLVERASYWGIDSLQPQP